MKLYSTKGKQRAGTFWSSLVGAESCVKRTDPPLGKGEFSRRNKMDRGQTVPAARAETGFFKVYVGGTRLGSWSVRKGTSRE